MKHIIYAATHYGYCVQVLDNGQIVHEYSAGNCWRESQTTVNPYSPDAVKLCQLRIWAKQTAGEIAREWGITRVEYDPDLEIIVQEELSCEL